ncbi:MAG: hypothetical protein KC462_07490, partial [Cyanobacteria bacterium HKST-UBA05]|nr:hypothetical protein [Cyanobacteria bacterium HKST-UBA05]
MDPSNLSSHSISAPCDSYPFSLPQCRPDEPIRLLLLSSEAMALALMDGMTGQPQVVEPVGYFPVSQTKKGAFLARSSDEAAIQAKAETYGIERLDVTRVNGPAFRAVLDTLKPHVVFVCIWPEIIKATTLAHAIDYGHGHWPATFINCHGSLLPKYRGARPYLAAIFNGDTQGGYTFHLMDEGVDTGDILFQESFGLAPNETRTSYFEHSVAKVGQAIGPFLADLKAGRIVARSQGGEASYVPQQKPHWGWIQWHLEPQVIERRIRAMARYVNLLTTLNNVLLGFENGHLVQAEAEEPVT